MAIELRWDQCPGTSLLPQPINPPTGQTAQGCAEISGALKTEDKASVCKKKQKTKKQSVMFLHVAEPYLPWPWQARQDLCRIQCHSLVGGFIECSHNALPLSKERDINLPLFFCHPPFLFANGILKWLSSWLSLSLVLKSSSLRIQPHIQKSYIENHRL